MQMSLRLPFSQFLSDNLYIINRHLYYSKGSTGVLHKSLFLRIIGLDII